MTLDDVEERVKISIYYHVPTTCIKMEGELDRKTKMHAVTASVVSIVQQLFTQ